MGCMRHHKGPDLLGTFPIVGAVWLWAKTWANLVMTFLCNNQEVVHIVNSLTSRFQRVMGLVRALRLHCLQFSIIFNARHVPGIDNTLADALSSQQIDRFSVLVPGAQFHLEVIPDEVWNLGG